MVPAVPEQFQGNANSAILPMSVSSLRTIKCCVASMQETSASTFSLPLGLIAEISYDISVENILTKLESGDSFTRRRNQHATSLTPPRNGW